MQIGASAPTHARLLARRYQLDDDVRSVSSASTHLSCMSITPRHAYFQRQAARLDATPHGLLTKISAHLPGFVLAQLHSLVVPLTSSRTCRAYLVRDAFCFFDREKTGRVTYEDFRAQIERFGLIGGEETTLTLFNTYDRDGKGEINCLHKGLMTTDTSTNHRVSSVRGLSEYSQAGGQGERRIDVHMATWDVHSYRAVTS